MARIYVFSTYLDLQECRKQVNIVIRKMGHEDVAMEYYVAEDRRATDRCLADVAECDVYVGIFAWRYGWVPSENNPEGRSITELEYRRALETGKKCLIFLLDENAPWPFANIQRAELPRIEALRTEMSARHIAAFFQSAEDIAGVVAPAIHRWAEDHGLGRGTLDEFTLKPYYDYLRQRYRHMDLDALTPPERDDQLRMQLRSLFVEQSVRETLPAVDMPKELWLRLEREREVGQEDLPAEWDRAAVDRVRESYTQKPVLPVLTALLQPRNSRAVILGDPGSGKSTLVRFLAVSLIDPEASPLVREALPGCLPWPIELKTYIALRREGRCENFLGFWECQSRDHQWNIDRAQFDRHLSKDGRVFVLFDGLDEVFDPGEREAVAEQIVSFCARYPNTRALVTSRVIGYQRKALSGFGFTHFTLQDLNRDQVRDFVTRWYDLSLGERLDDARDRRDRILRGYDAAPPLQQLAGNPLLLTIMAIIGKNQELPRERWKLYKHAAEVLVHHWDEEHHRAGVEWAGRNVFGVEDKKNLLQRLAYRMQQGQGGLAGNYIHEDDILRVFEEALKQRGLGAKEAIALARERLHQFRERNFILAWYGGSLYGFVHRAFLEYFCALEFVRLFHGGELTLDQLLHDVYGARSEDRSWHEPLRLIFSMLDEKWAEAIIGFLTNQKPADEPWNLVLAVRCLEDQRNPQRLKASGHLLRAICSWLIQNTFLSLFVRQELLQPAMGMGTEWADRESLIDWVWLAAGVAERNHDVRRLGNFVGSAGAGLSGLDQALKNLCSADATHVRILALSALASGWRAVNEIHVLVSDRAANDPEGSVRSSAVDGLAQYFSTHAQTQPLLLDRAANDPEGSVRSSAVYALAQHFSTHEQTRPLLLDRAANDPDGSVRRSAVDALAQYFSTQAQTQPLLLDRAANDPEWTVRSSAVYALAQHFSTHEQTQPLLLDRAANDPEWTVRSRAVYALAQHFSTHAQTQLLLLDRASNDPAWTVRSSAVDALAQYFSTQAQTQPLLLDRAANDPSKYVRSSAVDALAQHFSTHAQTQPLLLDRAANDSDGSVRSSAVYALAQHFSTHEQTQPLLDRAANDSDGSVRSSAVGALAQLFFTHEQTQPLLLDRAANDPNEYVRSSAVYALAQHFSTHEQTQPLLLDRAANDPNEYVRSSAVYALAQHFSTHAQTQPLLLDRAANDPNQDIRYRIVCELAKNHFHQPDVRELLLRLAKPIPTT